MLPVLDTLVREFQAASLPMATALLDYIPPAIIASYLVQLLWTLVRSLGTVDVWREIRRFCLLLLVLFLSVTNRFWLPQIPAGFSHVGEQLTQIGLSPDAFVGQGLVLSLTLYDSLGDIASVLNPMALMIRMAASGVVALSFGFVGVKLVLILVELAWCLGPGTLTLAFAGHRTTFPLVAGYLRYLFGLGLRLWALYTIVFVTQNLALAWNQRLESLLDQISFENAAVIVLGSISVALITWRVPDRFSEHVLGAGFGNHLNPHD